MGTGDSIGKAAGPTAVPGGDPDGAHADPDKG